MEGGMIVAAAAAVAVLMIAFGIAGSRQEDPLKARLSQLGQMTAKDLQELELQQPFIERTEKRLAMAGNPGDMKVADWLGIKAIGAGVGGGLMFLLFGILGGNIS